MKTLWITNDIFKTIYPKIKGRPTVGGVWLEPLFRNLCSLKSIRMATLTPIVNGEYQKIETGDIIHYTIPINRGENQIQMNNDLALRYVTVINDFQPDIIHIHGTEANFGLLRHFIDNKIPIVCSIQGIIAPCHEFLRQSTANIDYYKHRSLKNLLGRGGIKTALKKWNKQIPIEIETFKINQYFIGRTIWDMAYTHTYNPSAKYFQGEELLRPEFYNTSWSIETCQRHRIFISSSAYALKGFHILLKAVAILKKEFQNITIITPLSSIRKNSSKIRDLLVSEDYNNYLKNEIERLDLSSNIELKGKLTAEEMTSEFKRAHVFVLPSFIENSPNSLGEAMLIGTPTVVSPVGGVPSIVENNKSTLMFASGDYVMMAHQIKQIFINDNLALQISANAKNIAIKRHNIKSTTEQYKDIYTQIIKQHYEDSTYTP